MDVCDLLFAHRSKHVYDNTGPARFVGCRFEKVHEIGRDLHRRIRLPFVFSVAVAHAGQQVEYFLYKANLVLLQCLKRWSSYHIFPSNRLNDCNFGLRFRIKF